MKRKVLLVSVTLIMVIFLSFTMTTLYTVIPNIDVIVSGNVKLNLFQTAKEQTILPGDTVDNIVTVKNTGDTSAYLKIALSLTIDGNTADIDNYIEFNISDTSWIFKDGYYYYNTALTKDNTTNALFTKMHFKGENISNGFIGKVIELKITVYGVASVNNGSTPFDATGWPV